MSAMEGLCEGTAAQHDVIKLTMSASQSVSGMSGRKGGSSHTYTFFIMSAIGGNYWLLKTHHAMTGNENDLSHCMA